MGRPALKELLLLSGGIDSTALAVWRRPAATLVIDYGQRPALGELRAAAAVAKRLSLEHHELRIDCAPIGGGLLVGGPGLEKGPSWEWWPYRNQLLATLGAAWALPQGYDAIVLGSVRSDGFHVDGTVAFYKQLDQLVAMQEGNIRVLAPAIAMSTVELVVQSKISDDVLVWTTSCHRGPSACGDCPGCRKHERVLAEVGRFQ